nr:tetratricopeptide repeat protein [uncultured Rhodoferax sp.]
MQPSSSQAFPSATMLNSAIALHQKGQLQQAKVGYEAILAVEPAHYQALHLLGLVAVQTGDYAGAVDLIGKAIDIFSHDADFYANRGLALQQLQQFEAAVTHYNQALVLNPKQVGASSNRGMALHRLGRLDAALASYDQAVALSPGVADFHFFRGNVLQAMQRHDAAIASYNQAITLRPNYAQACFNRGFSFQALQHWGAALASYDMALSVHPAYAEAHCNRAAVLQALKRLDEAVESCDKALALRPDYAEAYTNRGVALYGLRRYEEALASYDAAIRYKPDYVKAHTNRGVALHGLKQWDAALASYDQAISLRPDYAQAHASRGLTLHACGQWHAALASFDAAIELDPNDAQSYFNKSMTLLLQGDLAGGLPLYEWRWETEASKPRKRHFKQPLWLGAEPVFGKTILLHSEQGYGDTIQFVRYARLLEAQGAQVVLEVPPALMGMLQGLEGVHTLVATGDPLPPFDMHCPLLSLPLAFKTNLRSIPAAEAYLQSDAGKVEQWSARLGPTGKPRVGLVWSGNAQHANDSNRSIALASLLPYLPDTCEYVSLHKDVRDADRESLATHGGIRHFGEQLQDFSDTAALVSLMDRVISVDTSTAHLSAALGKHTWILLPYLPDWRWLLDRDDSPWYMSAKLYRQSFDGDWMPVFQRLQTELSRL